MKNMLGIIFMLIAFQSSVFAQMKEMNDKQEFEQKLKQTAKNVKSIESDFTQLKHLDIFDNDISSKGKFYYRHNNKICMDYTSPVNYLIVINGDKLKTVADGKKSVVNLGSNKSMKEMRSMLAACMSGDLSRISSDYDLEYFEDTKYYLIIVKPKNKTVRDYISDFHIYLDKKDMSVDKLRISENTIDYTNYQFSNKKFNSLQNDEKFSVN
ncbi:MAG: outer membrane lipoprotein carrier protein LolA [Prevotellaceae bacterium]|jgi:outer membrane lipoprotein-sorting protein|nr:outer membrane lipoprotein carrier protein LolA [Prevotellaceae bacterium]